MISVITCTIRDECMDNVFQNYNSQVGKNKQLIIVLNKDKMNYDKWVERSKKYDDISVYRIEEGATLGDCLNFGIEKSKYDIIAKFDDDDFYGPNYLRDSIEILNKGKDIDIVGKNAYFVYLQEEEKLILMNSIENDYVDHVAGATLVFRRDLWHKVKFQKANRGEDYFFLVDAQEQGYKVYSGDRYNFTTIRKNKELHTWKQDNSFFIDEGAVINYTGDYGAKVVK
ncbi:glycosyltransferase [Alkaliphilus peptidifermentans]|uniref:Glycosyl transferase family 2 n=1 Tax=Alkaliphilus peptidifermentans DSM 18978 TaxID=1120976 RepID=A0A1G5F0P3_9FIRM|nr:glycosyltransferase family A protein [Alkaliphilus peptidifermentans]SCY32238.1 Glycosyl transferase family 2 [Alkaliphilus peptidifermentans DSM 18978]